MRRVIFGILTGGLLAVIGSIYVIKHKDKITANEHIKIQNDKGDIFYGETLYPNQITAMLNRYKTKYNIDIAFAETKNDFENWINGMNIEAKPKAIFQYNKGHKYGFIFVKYNNIDYCICVDTIPILSEYAKNNVSFENNKVFVEFYGKKYQAVIFGENLQKAQLGCGSFTIALLKQLLKDNAKYLFEVLDVYEKYGNGDKTQRDVSKKSCIRGVDFDTLKNTDFAPEIYKYSQNMALQEEFDDRLVGNKKQKMREYRSKFSAEKVNQKGEKKIISTKVFDITQKYKNIAKKPF